MNKSVMGQVDRWRQVGRWHDEADWVRVRSQLRFAEWLVQQNPAQTAWRQSLDEATALVLQGDGAAPGKVVEQFEKLLAPLAEAAKKHVIYCAGHAHIDMNWLWGWPETVAATLDTFRTMLKLLEEFPEFHFCQSQASVYAIVEEFEPEMLARIGELVRAGRWEVTASHWVENDNNIAGAEPLVRHLLQTRAYMRQLFDLSAEDVCVNWTPDSFGHAATLPTYLAQGGVRHVYMHRPGDLNQPVPEAFWWQGLDGARVLVRNDYKRNYNAVIEPTLPLDALFEMKESVGLDFTMLVFGVGDHGGGPTRRDLLMMREMNQWPIYPALVPATTRTFFERLESEGADLPVIEGELNFEFSGCYTSQSLIKRANRFGEARMLDVEAAAVMAQGTGGAAVEKKRLDANWRRVLFSHFHDILPGSCVRDVRLYCHGQFQDTMAFTTTATSQMLQAVAARVATDSFDLPAFEPGEVPSLFLSEGFGGGSGIAAVEGQLSKPHGHGLSPIRPFVVFNTTGAERHEVVEFMLWDREFPETAAAFDKKMFEAQLSDGSFVYVQKTGSGHEWGHRYQRYAVALTVPPFGYTSLAFREVLEAPVAPESGAKLIEPEHHCYYTRHERPAIGLENDYLRFEIDPATGFGFSLVDRESDTELLDAEIGLGLEYSVELPGTMNAWVINHARPSVLPELVSYKSLAKGPTLAGIELEYRIESSRAKLRYWLAAGECQLRVEFEADWLEAGNEQKGVPNLRLVLGTLLENPLVSYEIPFGWIDRETEPDYEVPALRWALMESENSDFGLLLLNDCKHGHAVTDSTMRVNLIRSSYNPDPFPELGEHKAAFALAVVPQGVCKSDVIAAGQSFNHPLLVQGAEVQSGELANENALVDVVGEGVVLSSVKLADDGEGLVLRVCNVTDEETEVMLVFNKLLGKPSVAQQVDLLERPLADGDLSIEGASVRLKVPARGIASCRVKVG